MGLAAQDGEQGFDVDVALGRQPDRHVVLDAVAVASSVSLAVDIAGLAELGFSKYGGTEIKVDGDEVLILRESDVLATVTPRTRKSKGKRELTGATA